MLHKELRRKKRHGRIRKKIHGTANRPRLNVRRSLKNIFVQVINDDESKTICAMSTLDKNFGKAPSPDSKGKIGAAEKLGGLFADRLKEKGITRVSFDRGGYKYHGRIKALADSLRKSGIEL